MNGMTAFQQRRQAQKPKIEYIAVSDGMILRKDRIISIYKKPLSRNVDFDVLRNGYQLIITMEESAGKTHEYTLTRWFRLEDEAESAGIKKLNEIMAELSK